MRAAQGAWHHPRRGSDRSVEGRRGGDSWADAAGRAARGQGLEARCVNHPWASCAVRGAIIAAWGLYLLVLCAALAVARGAATLCCYVCVCLPGVCV